MGAAAAATIGVKSVSLFDELKRRNVLRVAAGYVVLAWLVIQVAGEILPPFGFGDDVIRLIIIAFTIGFVPVVVIAWAFEWTPEGLRKEAEVDREPRTTAAAAKRWDRVVMAILAIAVAFFVFDKFMKPAAAPDNRVAVLPFVNLSSDPEQAFFAAGVAEEVRGLLARIPQLRVSSPRASFDDALKGLAIAEVAERLGVGHVVMGSVRKSGNEIRVSAQLVDIRDESDVWSDTIERKLEDIFEIQDEIAEKIVENLHIQLLEPMPVGTRTDPRALALTIQAKQIFYASAIVSSDALSGEGDRVAALLDKALEIDPNYSEAVAWYVYAEWLRQQEGLISADERRRRFDIFADRALAIDPEQAIILGLKAWNLAFLDGDPEAAAPLLERALRSAPNDAEVLRQVGRFAYSIDRYDEARAFLEAAVQVNPDCTMCLYFLSRNSMYSGRLEEAEEQRSRFVLITDGGGSYHYGVIRLLRGDAEAALGIFDKPEKMGGYQSLAGLALTYHTLGQRQKSDEALAALIEEYGDSAPGVISTVLAWRNEKDAAFEWLDKALGNPDDPDFNGFSVARDLRDPIYKNLHDDPRWEEILERTGWPPERFDAIKFDVSIPE